MKGGGVVAHIKGFFNVESDCSLTTHKVGCLLCLMMMIWNIVDIVTERQLQVVGHKT